MIVVTLSTCPARLRGDLTKWLMELDTGVYVGNVSSRVRELLWKRIEANIGNGRAVMAFSTNNEQKFDFKLLNTKRTLADFDGLLLLQQPVQAGKPEEKREKTPLPHYYGLEVFQAKAGADAKKPRDGAEESAKETGRAAKARPERKNGRRPAALRPAYLEALPDSAMDYTVLDIETGGLDPISDPIIEIGAVKVRSGRIVDRMACLIHTEVKLPEVIVKLTSLTNEILDEKGVSLREGLEKYLDFSGGDVIIGHNVVFDIDFINEKCVQEGLGQYDPRFIDTLTLARKRLSSLGKYKLTDLIEAFKLGGKQCHRALNDASLEHEVFIKLNEIT